MGKIKILFLFTLLAFQHEAFSQQVKGTASKAVDGRQWIRQHFAKGKVPPFSFVYGGKNSADFIKSWGYKVEKGTPSGSNTETSVYTYSDKQSGLVVKCLVTCFNDFQAVEWELKFSNTSENNTPLIEKAAVIDQTFGTTEKGSFNLYHAKGSNAERSDFQPIDEKLEVGKNIYMTPTGGRSSDNTAFPFFNIGLPGQQGIVVAVGWSGKWYADINQLNEKTISLKSGMEKMKLALYPKEEIRTPKICLLFWKGEDRMTGHNQFRQFVLAHHTQKMNGKHVELPLAAFLARGGPSPCNEHVCATEGFAVAEIRRHQQFNIVPEVFWLDAGWYSCKGQWPNTGNWTPNKENFPNGLKPVTNAAHTAGAKFILWLEPERVTEGTEFANKNPDWIIKIGNNKNFLFDLGNTEARLWMTDYVSNLIKKEGVDYYRQDFNMDPMPYWTANDKPNRTGISEIRHIEGLYAYWDSLLVRFPDLLIDNCASGGRRIDLETTSRSSPLWRTDYQYGEPNGSQCHAYGLNFYLPLSGTGNVVSTPYAFRSSMSSAVALMWDINNSSRSLPQMQKCMQEFKQLRPFYYSDYYPLTQTDNMTKDNVWLAYQLNRPEASDGIIMAFRREDAPEESIQVQLRGIDKTASYELLDEDTQKKIIQNGEQLSNGIALSLKEKKTSLLISYKKVNNQ
ncbi:glycoside hydrolase family 36 protein [Chitinophaga sp. MM2321]|uniref:glycoside hydrolase family 36 protein n=1 Tax=Chitinophaga sp. MM2321 TaxID=3137178 RepID=UPI0032D58DCC